MALRILQHVADMMYQMAGWLMLKVKSKLVYFDEFQAEDIALEDPDDPAKEFRRYAVSARGWRFCIRGSGQILTKRPFPKSTYCAKVFKCYNFEPHSILRKTVCTIEKHAPIRWLFCKVSNVTILYLLAAPGVSVSQEYRRCSQKCLPKFSKFVRFSKIRSVPIGLSIAG